jgi:hypothetical protein
MAKRCITFNGEATVMQVPLKQLSSVISKHMKTEIERHVHSILDQSGLKYTNEIAMSSKHEHFYSFNEEGVCLIDKIYASK